MTDQFKTPAAKKSWKRLSNYVGSGTAGPKIPVLHGFPVGGETLCIPLGTPDTASASAFAPSSSHNYFVEGVCGTDYDHIPHSPYSNYRLLVIDDCSEEPQNVAFRSAESALHQYCVAKASARTRGFVTGELAKLPKRARLKGQIHALLDSASEPNWDGEGAEALVRSTVRFAQELVDFFPAYIEDPDVGVTPLGEVDFDWVVSKETMLTISVAPSGEIAFAGRFAGASRVDGIIAKREKMSSLLAACFDELNRHSD